MMRTINRQNIFIRIMSITTIIAASIILVILITEFENFGIVQSQLSNTTSSLTPPQKAAMCNPNNPKLKFVNSTGSKICRIPRTSTNDTTTTLAVNTTGRRTRTGNEIPLPRTSVSSSNTSTMIKQLQPLYGQGYTKGVADAKSVQITTRHSGTIRPDDVDCDVDSKASNENYCSGYQHRYADTNNHELLVR